MTWKELELAYQTRIAHLVVAAHKKAMRGFTVLEENLQHTFPEAIKNPALLLETEWRELREKLNHYKHTNDASNSLMKIRVLLQKMPNPRKLHTENAASRHAFTKEDIVYCATHWLNGTGWDSIYPLQMIAGKHDSITAEKKGEKFFGMAIGSVNNNEPHYQNANLHAFKARMGKVLLSVLDQMITHPKTVIAVFIADDIPTRKFATPYFPYMKKLGIKIYLIKSAGQIQEK